MKFLKKDRIHSISRSRRDTFIVCAGPRLVGMTRDDNSAADAVVVQRKIRTHLDLLSCLKKNQNAPRPSEHPPVRGEKMSNRLGGINS